MDLFLALFLLLVFVTLCVYAAMRKPAGLPPGPPKLPILGSLPFLPKVHTRGMVRHIVAKYGPVASAYFGPRRTVIISDPAVLRDVLKMDAASARNSMRPLNEIRFGGSDGQSRGIVYSSGKEWTEQRRFSLRHLKDFGFGKKSMEEVILTEVRKLSEEIEKMTSEPMSSLNLKLNISIVNALWTIMAGHSFDLDDPRLHKVVEACDSATRGVNRFSTLVYLFPGLARHFWSGYQSFKTMYSNVMDLILPIINEHEETFDANSMRDFIDVYLREIAETKDPHSSFFGEMGKKSMHVSVFDLFLTGGETMSSSLLWTLLYLVLHPDVQKKVHSELDSVVGASEDVLLEHEPLLPYTRAVILESLRIVSLVPLSVQHCTTEDITVKGYNIPKDTNIMANLIAIHHDPALWSDPHSFRPERFLSADGLHVIHSDLIMPFSVGKRECLGKTLAEKEFFLFLAGMAHRFRFSPAEGAPPLPSTDPKDDASLGIVRTAPTFYMKITKRARM